MTSNSSRDRSHRVALLPYMLATPSSLADVRLSDLKWFFEEAPTEGTVADLGADDHLIFYARRQLLLGTHARVRCHLTPLLAEPLALYRRFYAATALTSWRWFRILTYHPTFLRFVPNARFWPLGSSWVGNPSPDQCVKTRHMSLIASSKTVLIGHRLRHEIAGWVKSTNSNVDLLGLAYKPFEHKIDGLAPYRFSVVIENARDKSYFTEKLVDAFLCRTVPIYWGAPNIDEFFDTGGMILCETAADLRRAISSAASDEHARMSDAIERNYQTALAYLSQDRNAVELIAREMACSSQ